MAGQATRVRIGSRYEPWWFERRHADGRYEGLRVPMSHGEVALQRALLNGRRTFSWSRLAVVLLTVAVFVLLWKVAT